ncbi:protein SMG5-like isoform X2, partial [Leptotrombidium deliense]
VKFFTQDITSEAVVLLETHFISGVGHYESLLKRLAGEFGINICHVLPDTASRVVRYEEPLTSEVSTRTEKEVDIAKQCIHRIFICLGDIFRYLDELGFTGNHVLAIKWYNTAINFNPIIGMPYNQLGTLSGSVNYGLDAAYYYMRCTLTEKPFDGAESNLIRLFKANAKISQEQPKENVQESVGMVKQCISRFLVVANELWNVSHQKDNLATLIQDCFTSLKEALELPAKITTAHKPTFLEPSSIFKMGASILMCIDKLENSGVQSGSLHSAAVAFAINFLFLIITSSSAKIKDKFEKGNELSKPVQTMMNGNIKLSSSQLTSKENTPELSPRRTLSRLRRRKAAIKYDDIDMNFLDFDDDDSELSELEETALSTIDALEISSDISESGSVCDENDFNNHLNSSDEEDSQGATRSNPELHAEVEGILQFIYFDTSLAIVKIYCDWLRLNHTLLAFCVESFSNLFSIFSELCNTLLAVETKSILSNKRLQEYKYTDLNWEQKYPLTIDHALRNFRALEKLHSKCIDFSNARQLTGDEMGFLCIQSVLSFGHFVINNVNKCSLRYDAFTKRFMAITEQNGSLDSRALLFHESTSNGLSDNDTYVRANGDCISLETKRNVDIQIANKSPSPEYLENDSNKQKQMMRNMAHLWLKSEVSKLEKTVKGGRLPQLSPYLVMDSSAYLDHLNLVKDLVYTKRFIVVVPKIVLAILDHKKKVSANAREAIRWLEVEVQRGNRFVKFQGENERSTLAPIKYPRRKDKDAYSFFVLLEYCNYLHQFSNSQMNNKKDIATVTLLYSSNNTFPVNSDAVVRSVGMYSVDLE